MTIDIPIWLIVLASGVVLWAIVTGFIHASEKEKQKENPGRPSGVSFCLIVGPVLSLLAAGMSIPIYSSVLAERAKAEFLESLPAEWKQFHDFLLHETDETIERAGTRRFTAEEPSKITASQFKVACEFVGWKVKEHAVWDSLLKFVVIERFRPLE